MNRCAFQMGLVVMLIACGCGPKQAPAPVATEIKKKSPLPPPVAVATQPATPSSGAPVSHPVPPSHSGSPVTTAAETTGKRPTVSIDRSNVPAADLLEALNEAVANFGRDHRRPPKSMKELMDNKYVRAIPPAPPGKKFDFNPTKNAFELVSN